MDTSLQAAEGISVQIIPGCVRFSEGFFAPARGKNAAEWPIIRNGTRVMSST